MLTQEQRQHDFLTLVVGAGVLEGFFQVMGACVAQGARKVPDELSFLENEVKEKGACALPADRSLRAL